MTSTEVGIEIETLQIERGGRALFCNPITTSFKPGALNILTGPNGSGKTSLLDIVALRAAPPQSAMIRRTGHSVATEIAYLPQQLCDALDVRVHELVALATGFRALAKIHEPPPTVKAISCKKGVLEALSGGQRQLLLFWLVSCQSQRFFVYDEPLRHLDSDTSKYVIQVIENQVRTGLLVLLSEHSHNSRWDVRCNCIELG